MGRGFGIFIGGAVSAFLIGGGAVLDFLGLAGSVVLGVTMALVAILALGAALAFAIEAWIGARRLERRAPDAEPPPR